MAKQEINYVISVTERNWQQNWKTIHCWIKS